MSDEVKKLDSLNKEEKSNQTISMVRLSQKNELALSKENLNETNSPKVTRETFNEYSLTKLKDVFFSGTYEDRVYVESLEGYRDRVIIDEEETRFSKSLKSVLRRGKKLCGDQFQGIKSKLVLEYFVTLRI